MKKTLSLLLCLTLTAGAVCLFSSCGDGTKLTAKEAALYDKETDTSYFPASLSYDPIVTGEVVAHLKTAGEKVLYYEVAGVSPTVLLADASGCVMVAGGVSLPTPADTLPDKILLQDEYGETLVGTLENADNLRAVTSSIAGEGLSYPNLPTVSLHVLRLEYTAFGLYYTVNLLEYEKDYEGNGRYFLYDIYNRKHFSTAPACLVDLLAEEK